MSAPTGGARGVRPSTRARIGRERLRQTAYEDEYFAEEPVDSAAAIALDRLLDCLDERSREVLELRIYGLQSYRAIARHYGWMLQPRNGGKPYPDHKRAWKIVHRALAELRDEIKNNPEFSFLIPEEV